MPDAPDFVYVQATGELFAAGTNPVAGLPAKGYAGRGEGLNNPSMQNVHEIGPLPQGFYRCGFPVTHTRLGPDAIPLDPFPDNQMFTRGGFYCHADNAKGDKSASEGCIVMPGPVRALLVPGSVVHVVAAVFDPVYGGSAPGAAVGLASDN